MPTTKRSVEEIERDRMTLFERYLHLEEVLETYNEEKYQVCLSIERLNMELKEAIAEEEKARRHPVP